MKQLNKNFFDIHADDYSLSDCSDNDIITLCKNEKLNSISILPNLDIFESSVKKFLEAKKGFYQDVKTYIHLNVLEGKSICSFGDLPDLVDYEGYFKISWFNLFIWNYIPPIRQKIKEQLTKEITAQINKCIQSKIVNKDALRITSNHHVHMIPVFFEALEDSINQNNFKVEYIRNTYDPLLIYIFSKEGLKYFSLKNFIKCHILNIYSKKVSRYILRNRLKDSYVMGIYLNGKMEESISTFIPDFEDYAAEDNRICEILFHPGLMYNTELTKEFKKIGFNNFHLSSNRKVEFNTCNRL